MPLTLLFSPLFIGIFAIIFALFLMTRDSRSMNIIRMILFVFAFIIGFVLYTFGYLSGSANPLEVPLAALRGLFSTGRMFLINDDYGFLIDAPEAGWLVSNVLLQILFWLAHVLALTVSVSALMSIFGHKLIVNFRLRFGLHRQVYIITGTDKKALILGKNIATKDGETTAAKSNSLVVFLADKVSEAENNYEEITSFGAVVIEDENDFLAGVIKTGLGKWYGHRRSYKFILMPDNTSAVDSIEKLVDYAKQENVNPRKLDVFAIVKSEWDRKSIEKLTKKYQYSLHITDETNIATRQLLLKHPAFELLNFNNGVAQHDFTAMIIGFGNIGQQTLLRLIMNGQFVGSRMKAVIIDAEIERLRGRFLHRYPSLNLSCDMTFHAVNVQNEDFYALLKQTDAVSYIVIALDNEDQSKQAAQDLHIHYLRAQKELPLIAVAAENNDMPWDSTICFARQADIYTVSALIHEDADKMAMAVNSVYMRETNAPTEDFYSLWQKLDWFSKESNRASADFIPALLYLSGITSKEAVEQDKLTEDSVLAEILAHTEHMRWVAFHVTMGYRPMDLAKMTLSRKNTEQKLHLCLVPWEKLDEIGGAYNELGKCTNDFVMRDFKADDYNVIQNVPLFLQALNRETK